MAEGSDSLFTTTTCCRGTRPLAAVSLPSRGSSSPPWERNNHQWLGHRRWRQRAEVWCGSEAGSILIEENEFGNIAKTQRRGETNTSPNWFCGTSCTLKILEIAEISADEGNVNIGLICLIGQNSRLVRCILIYFQFHYQIPDPVPLTKGMLSDQTKTALSL